MSKGVIVQKLCVISGDINQLILFVCAFYAFEYLLFYNHHNHESNLTIIPSAMKTYQGNLLGGALFALVQFRALHSTTSNFPSCLFPSIVDDIHIISPFSIVSSAYEHFQTELHAIGLSIHPSKCVTWSSSSLPSNVNTPS
jgi:hypothetical protein